MLNSKELFAKRAKRVRYNLQKKMDGRARLSVFRSSNHIYAQIIDDKAGHTISSASTKDKALQGVISKGTNVEAASAVGKLLGERAIAAGIHEVVFDRGGYRFHGRVKALADAAREVGIKF